VVREGPRGLLMPYNMKQQGESAGYFLCGSDSILSKRKVVVPFEKGCPPKRWPLSQYPRGFQPQVPTDGPTWRWKPSRDVDGSSSEMTRTVNK